jgi:hypothetical protein
MTQSAVPEHACVRVGPASAVTLIAGWPQACDCGNDRRATCHAVTGMLLAADDRAPMRWLETADVIIVSAVTEGADPVDWLRRYPGCAVVAAWTRPNECSVATRSTVLRGLAVSGRQGDSAAFACAAFVHGWLAARLPLTLLSPACLQVAPEPAATWPRAGSPLFFRFSYRPMTGGDSSADPPGPAL